MTIVSFLSAGLHTVGMRTGILTRGTDLWKLYYSKLCNIRELKNFLP